MTLRQAFTQWAVAPRNTVLAAKSRTPVERVLMKHYGDMHLEVFTEQFCRRLFSQCRETLEMQVKAASILCYVLQWGGDHGHCQRPTFTYDIASDEYHRRQQAADAGTAAKPATPAAPEDTMQPGSEEPSTGQKPLRQVAEETVAGMMRENAPQPKPAASEPVPSVAVPQRPNPKTPKPMKKDQTPAAPGSKKPRGAAPRPVVQIDRQTLQPLQQFPSMADAAKATGCLSANVHRAVTQLRTAGGYFWTTPDDAPRFAELLAHKKASPASQRATAASATRSATASARRKQAGKPEPKAKPAQPAKPAATPAVPSVAVPQRPNPAGPAAAERPLAAFTDRQLADELRRRGWQGDLTRTLSL